MNTDCVFYIGTTHDVCQDYALTNNNNAVISDGCSSSKYSDVGARILSITTMNKLHNLNSFYNFEEKEIILLARPSIKMLDIPQECLDATILAAKIFNNGLQALCCGDGVIVIKTKEGKTIIVNCTYTDSYPFYMNYLYNITGGYTNWKENHNKRHVVQLVYNSLGDMMYNLPVESQTERIQNDIGLIRTFENKTIVEITNKEDIEYIAIISDGIHSFQETITTNTSKYNQSIPYLTVLEELLSFKNFNKAFVKRRVKRFRKDCCKKNWHNYDDLSLAVIYIGE